MIPALRAQVVVDGFHAQTVKGLRSIVGRKKTDIFSLRALPLPQESRCHGMPIQNTSPGAWQRAFFNITEEGTQADVF